MLPLSLLCLLINSTLRDLHLTRSNINPNHKTPGRLVLADFVPRSKVAPHKRHPDLSINGVDDAASAKLLDIALFGQRFVDRVRPLDLQVEVAHRTVSGNLLAGVDGLCEFSPKVGEDMSATAACSMGENGRKGMTSVMRPVIGAWEVQVLGSGAVRDNGERWIMYSRQRC